MPPEPLAVAAEQPLDHLIAPDGFQSIRVSRKDGVVTICLLPNDGLIDGQPPSGRPLRRFAQHKDIGDALLWLATDAETRVVILTGTDEVFYVPPKPSSTLKPLPPEEDWALIEGLRRTLLAVISLDKPVIAQVNGDAVGYGSSLVYACDFIVAAETALIGDHHLGMGDLPHGRKDFGFVAGDGGSVFVPLHMTPVQAKEYLMLGRTWTARELAGRGVINDAVPADRLAATVGELARRLTLRPHYALAWTKRVINQPVVNRFNEGYDAGMALEVINILHRRAEDARQTGA